MSLITLTNKITNEQIKNMVNFVKSSLEKNERKEVVTETPIVEESKKRFLKINNYL